VKLNQTLKLAGCQTVFLDELWQFPHNQTIGVAPEHFPHSSMSVGRAVNAHARSGEKEETNMGKIVAAFGTVHAPQLFVRPPSEDLAQLDADIAAMRLLGKDLDETKPDVVVVMGNDHMETFFLSSVPTFAIMSGERARAEFARKTYDLPVHQGLAEDLLDKLVNADFDMAYSQDAVLGHAFAAVYEWVIEGRKIPVVPIFVNAYLPPLPTARRCEQLGKAIAKVIAARPERVAVIASGGMSHFPGTWKYPQPDFEFDYWAIAQMEKGNHEALLNLTSEQLDVVGNTEMLSWMIMFGMIGDQPGELITYQPTWHHGHAVMRFLPDKRTGKLSEEGTKGPATYKFKGSEGYEFYKHPSPSAYKLNKILYDLRFKPSLRVRLINDIPSVAAEYGLPVEESKVLETLQDEDIEKFRNGTVHPLVKAGAHPLGMWMSVIVFHAELRRLRAAAATGDAEKTSVTQ
jgi:AmmeMemoRadiSam system protein B